MIKDYDEFKANIRAGTNNNIDNLILLKKARPYTFSQYKKRYQKERREIADIQKIKKE